ncbi:MAG TPA: tRNA (adenosine(37)-N6)-threonylcarbamoyltransferase complex ATPase subunit type 1 TsaE [Mariprofundaceae bacterium]|nr:tRNA (adenosine(37)-N6)-threonylcarbamoyltransferase complex ATPase subunit type 1 TsaE [Mariprofundaceae bacterium]
MSHRLRLENEKETCAYAVSLAETLKPGSVIALSGNLGAGKSVFARALMRALGVVDEAMPSPTFALIQTYDGRNCRVAHMDWYRLEDRDEIEMLGIRDYFAPPWISIIEWPERAPELIPDGAIRLRLHGVDDNVNARILESL